MPERLLLTVTIRDDTSPETGDTGGHLSRGRSITTGAGGSARTGGTVVATLHGPVDVNARVALDEFAQRVAGTACLRVVVDLAGVDFADCAGLAALEAAHRTLAEQGVPMVCTGTSEAMRRLLKWLPDPPRLTFAPPAEPH